jgi:hypothetical protein
MEIKKIETIWKNHFKNIRVESLTKATRVAERYFYDVTLEDVVCFNGIIIMMFKNNEREFQIWNWKKKKTDFKVPDYNQNVHLMPGRFLEYVTGKLVTSEEMEVVLNVLNDFDFDMLRNPEKEKSIA